MSDARKSTCGAARDSPKQLLLRHSEIRHFCNMLTGGSHCSRQGMTDIKQGVLAEARPQLKANLSLLAMLNGNTPLEELIAELERVGEDMGHSQTS